MSLNDRPPYLQPRIRHITSLRIHRLAVPWAEARIDTQHEDAAEASGAGIKGYDLAIPSSRGPQVRAQEVSKQFDKNKAVKLDDGQEKRERGLLDEVIHDVLAEEADEGLQIEDGMHNVSGTETQSLSTGRRGELPDLQFRRNRRRTSNNSTVTLSSIPQNASGDTKTPSQEGRTRSFSHLPPPTSPSSLHTSANATSSSTPVPGGAARRPSISMHRSRSRLTIPRHVDREFDSPIGGNGRSGSWPSASGLPAMNGNANPSPLVSPVSPGFFVPLPIPERSTSSQADGSACSVPVDGRNGGVGVAKNIVGDAVTEEQAASSLPSPIPRTAHEGKVSLLTSSATGEKSTAHGYENEAVGVPPYTVQRSSSLDEMNRPRSSTKSKPSPTTEHPALALNQTRARSTSISSSRSHSHTYTNLHIPYSGYPTTTAVTSAGGVGIGGHRRERSGTASSIHHPIAVGSSAGDIEGGRQRQQALNPHPEETMNGTIASIPLPLQQMGEEVPYVDQRILRNRLVRCFVTFATVETDEGRNTQQRQRREKSNSSARRRLGGDVNTTVSSGETASDTTAGSKEMHTIANALFPFYISPIHIRSTHPTFSGLSPRSDYANWLSVKDGAAHTLVVDVWVELEVPAQYPESNGSRVYSKEGEAERRSGGGFAMTWRKLRGVGGIVDLRRLHEVDETLTTALPENTLIFTFSTCGERLFYFALPKQGNSFSTRSEVLPTIGGTSNAGKAMVNSVMERSLRETKMRKSVGLGELHHMMNLYTVIRDTERDVRRMERDLNAKVAESAQAINEARTCSQQIARCNDLQHTCDKIRTGNVEHAARVESRRNALRVRQASMEDVKEKFKMLKMHRNDLTRNLQQLTSTIESIQLPICRHRARSIAQVNDIFEISPVDAATLLYSILQVPLPIPQHASEAAPPLSLPSSALPRGVKVDEDTISTALGFVALAVNQISHILDRPLTYPLTCAGSKSLVKDTISIIQGPRSFPLYAKGVEKYRYDYGVFLLNKNIELLMVDAGIKLEDMRHTLPNLKMLLLTLAAQDRPRARAT